MATFTELSQEVARIGGLEYANESASSDAWAKAGLRAIARAGAWPWLKASFELSLVADQYAYNFSDIASDLFRLNTRTIRYGGPNSFLRWVDEDTVDADLGPAWKDSGTDGGTPKYVFRFGNQLWLAKKPSAEFVASNAKIYGYYWREENFSGTLYLPDPFFECAVVASLAHGWAEEDDPRCEQYKGIWRNDSLPQMYGTTLDVGARDRMDPPTWAHYTYEGEYRGGMVDGPGDYVSY